MNSTWTCTVTYMSAPLACSDRRRDMYDLVLIYTMYMHWHGIPKIRVPDEAWHLESWPPGINVYRHVCTMYVQCTYHAIIQQLTDMVCTIFEKHKHVHTCIYISANVYTRVYIITVHGMYMVCTCLSINAYVHCSDMYVHVYTIMYAF